VVTRACLALCLHVEWFSNDRRKTKTKAITTGADSTINQSQFLAITCNSLEAWEKSRVHGAIGFGFASHWLKNWRESFKPITKRSNRNHVITFDSHLKIALSSSHPNCSCLLCWPYLQFSCSVELCGLLLCLPILPIRHPALPIS